MHLLPVYYSTTNTRKRKQKKKTASVLEAERQHAKFLKKMGIGTRSSVGLEQRPSKPWVAGSSPAECAKLESHANLLTILLWQRKKRMFIPELRLSVLHKCINLMQYQFVVRNRQKKLLR
jgi:hypothetical protein